MFILICKMLPRQGEEVKYRGGFETYETREEAEKAAHEPLRQNLPYRARVVEVQNPWTE